MLLQLSKYLSGDALKVKENLGHAATAYEAAKERLERKYGGMRRQIVIYLEDLELFRPIRPGNAKDMDKFVDLLDIAIIISRKQASTSSLVKVRCTQRCSENYQKRCWRDIIVGSLKPTSRNR